MKQWQHGFTLMELLVVMAMIAILAAVMVGNFTQTTLKARDTQRKSDMAQLQRALEAYNSDYGSYPLSAAGTIQGYAWGAPFAGADGTVYMSQLLNDKKQPSIQFRYETDDLGKKYQIMTYLENPQDTQITTDPNITGRFCGTDFQCNYAISSSNTTMSEVLN